MGRRAIDRRILAIVALLVPVSSGAYLFSSIVVLSKLSGESALTEFAELREAEFVSNDEVKHKIYRWQLHWSEIKEHFSNVVAKHDSSYLEDLEICDRTPKVSLNFELVFGQRNTWNLPANSYAMLTEIRERDACHSATIHINFVSDEPNEAVPNWLNSTIKLKYRDYTDNAGAPSTGYIDVVNADESNGKLIFDNRGIFAIYAKARGVNFSLERKDIGSASQFVMIRHRRSANASLGYGDSGESTDASGETECRFDEDVNLRRVLDSFRNRMGVFEDLPALQIPTRIVLISSSESFFANATAISIGNLDAVNRIFSKTGINVTLVSEEDPGRYENYLYNPSWRPSSATQNPIEIIRSILAHDPANSPITVGEKSSSIILAIVDQELLGNSGQIGGLGYCGSAQSIPLTLYQRVAAVKATAACFGRGAASHEIGHLLGGRHQYGKDNRTSPAIFGHAFSTDDSNTLMADYSVVQRLMRFSSNDEYYPCDWSDSVKREKASKRVRNFIKATLGGWLSSKSEQQRDSEELLKQLNEIYSLWAVDKRAASRKMQRNFRYAGNRFADNSRAIRMIAERIAKNEFKSHPDTPNCTARQILIPNHPQKFSDQDIQERYSMNGLDMIVRSKAHYYFGPDLVPCTRTDKMKCIEVSGDSQIFLNPRPALAKDSYQPEKHSLQDFISRVNPSAIIVEGHADSTGGKRINEELSARRSQRFAKIVGELATVPVVACNFGESRSLSCPDGVDESVCSDRRVEIKLLKPSNF